MLLLAVTAIVAALYDCIYNTYKTTILAISITIEILRDTIMLLLRCFETTIQYSVTFRFLSRKGITQ